MKQKLICFIAPMPLVLLLVGCSTTSRPGESNFFEAVHGLSTGRFEEQTLQDQRDTEEAAQENSAENIKNNSLSKETKQKEMERAAFQSGLDKMQKKSQGLSEKIDKLSAGNSEQRAKAVAMKKRVKQVQGKLTALKNSPEGLDYEDQVRQKNKLEGEIKALLKLGGGM